jgi:hypothetical protein
MAEVELPVPVISTDLLCSACRYNLRTQRVDGRCPECGQEIRKTFENALRFEKWMQSVAGVMLFVFVLNVITWLTLPNLNWLGRHHAFAARVIIQVSIWIFAIYTGWLLGSNPRWADEPASSRLMRVSLRFTAVCAVLAFATTSYSPNVTPPIIPRSYIPKWIMPVFAYGTVLLEIFFFIYIAMLSHYLRQRLLMIQSILVAIAISANILLVSMQPDLPARHRLRHFWYASSSPPLITSIAFEYLPDINYIWPRAASVWTVVRITLIWATWIVSLWSLPVLLQAMWIFSRAQNRQIQGATELQSTSS